MIETFVRIVRPDVVEYEITSRSKHGIRVAAMTTITDWQPLPNVPVERVIIVFEKGEA
jgi:hypothetical protein